MIGRWKLRESWESVRGNRKFMTVFGEALVVRANPEGNPGVSRVESTLEDDS